MKKSFTRAGVLIGACAALVSMAAPAADAAVPAGYSIARSAQITAPPYSQTHGSVTCPGATVPSAGGAVNQSFGLPSAVNSSYPSGQSWEVDFNNQSSTTSAFMVWTVCLTPKTGRRVVVTKDISVPTGTEVGGVKACPGATVPIGGGAVVYSASQLVSINDSYPLVKGWEVEINNNSPSDTIFRVYAVCEPQPGTYSIQNSGFETAPAGQTTVTQTPCGPSATNVAIGGGMYTTSADTGVQMYDSFPNSNGGWTAHLQNNSGTAPLVETYAICAGK
jgi:hypothetical protein